MRSALLLLAMAVVPVACDRRAEPVTTPAPSARPAAPPRGVPAARQAAGIVYEELVTGGARADDVLPLVVAIHGLGDRPSAFAGIFAGWSTQARVAVLRGFDAYGDGWSWFPYRDGDDAGNAEGIRRAAERVAPAIAAIARDRPTRGRPVVTGFSQGGMLSFAIAAAHPELVVAAFPMSGFLPPALVPASKRDAAALPWVVALHGDADPRVPVDEARRSVAALQRLGYRAELRVFPGVGHAVPLAERTELLGLARHGDGAARIKVEQV